MLKTNKNRLFIKGFKFPIYPNNEQKELLEKTFGCVRYVWNKALAEAKQEYEEYLIIKNNNNLIGTNKNPNITGFYFANKLSKYRSQPENSFLTEIRYDILQQSLINLGTAYSDFFKRRKGYPKFKKKNISSDSFRLTQNVFKLKNKIFHISKFKDPIIIGWGRNNNFRDLPSYPSSCVVSKSKTGQYYVSFICEYYPDKTKGKGEIGIDLGIKDFIVISDGKKISNPKYYKKYEINLKRKQQKLSRSIKNSNNFNKIKIKIAKLHEKISNSRNNFQHQISRQLINENQVIGIENLLVKNMIKNRKLSKAISQVAWSSFITKLIYKARESQHCNIVKIDTFYPSTHICNDTQLKIDFKLKLSDREFICPHCKQIHDRDINAAKNIKDEALIQMTKLNVPLKGFLVLV